MSGLALRRAGITCVTHRKVIGIDVVLASAQQNSPVHLAARAAVEHFLDVLGKRHLDQLPALFDPKATMVVVRQRDGQWSHSVSTSDEFLATLKAQATPTMFTEPLTNVSVHVEDGRLAFVRADFTVVIGGEVRSHGVDYFTLVKDGGAWKLVNGSYTSKTGAPR